MTNSKYSSARDDRTNIHIGYDQQVNQCHRTVSDLVVKYCVPNGRVLDIGCGVGHILSETYKKAPSLELNAADIDNNTLDITQSRVELAGRIKIDSVEDLFVSKQQYDAIVLSHVLEHTFRPLDVIKGIVEMLKPGGVLVVAVPNPVRLSVFLGNMSKRHYVNRGHVYAWDRSHWVNFLENIAKLDVVEYSQDKFPLRRLQRFAFGQSLELWLARKYPWLAFSNIAVVRAPTTITEN